MRDRMKPMAIAALLVGIACGSAQAAEPVKVAYSEKFGLTVFANPDASGQWCRPHLSLSVLLKADSPLLTQGINSVLSGIGRSLNDQCPSAEGAKIAVYNDSTRDLVGPVMVVKRSDNWLPQTVQQTPPPQQPDTVTPSPVTSEQIAPSQPLRCDHSLTSTDYFVTVCVVRGLEYRQKYDALAEARNRLDAASKMMVCAPGTQQSLFNVAQQTAVNILTSNHISPLMDFNDAMAVECKRGAIQTLQQ